MNSIEKDAVMSFFDSRAAHWDDDLIVDERKINIILDAAGIKPGVRVLDVACGTGVLFPFYMQRSAAGVRAVDLSPEMIKIARQKTCDARFEIIAGDVEELAAKPDCDCCVVYNALPHFPDPQRLITKLAAWLAPGGRLTVAHGLSIAQLNARHAGKAAHVSRGLMPAETLAAMFSPLFCVDTCVSDDEKYIVSGTLACGGRSDI